MNIAVPRGYLKFGGFALLIGGFMGFLGQLLHIGDTPDTLADIPGFLNTAVSTHVLLAWASILILLGMPAIYLRQAGSLRIWGWIGFPLLFIAMMLEIFHGPVQILAYPILFGNIHDAETLALVSKQVNELLVDQYPVSLLVLIPLMPALILGLLLLGISAIRARTYPKWIGWLTIAALLILILPLQKQIPILNYAFSLVHVVYMCFGAALVFDWLRRDATAGVGGLSASQAAE